MYHVGKVLEVFNTTDKNVVTFDNSTQAMLDMWDENLLTLQIDPHISKSIKKEDVVLVDYTATPTGPKMIVVKILRGELARRTWKQYKQHLDKMRIGKNTAPIKSMNLDKQSYVG
jgi:hypothetical protein